MTEEYDFQLTMIALLFLLFLIPATIPIFLFKAVIVYYLFKEIDVIPFKKLFKQLFKKDENANV